MRPDAGWAARAAAWSARGAAWLTACAVLWGGVPGAGAQENVWARPRGGKPVPSVPSEVPRKPFLGDLGEGYDNYAFTGYRNYDTFLGRPPWFNVYDPLGNFLISGQQLYSWDRVRTLTSGTRGGASGQSSNPLHYSVFNGMLSIGGQSMKGWASNVVISPAPRDPPFLDFFKEGIITRFTPLTLNRTSLHGVRADVVTPFGDAVSLIAASRYHYYSGQRGPNFHDSAILLGGHYQKSLGLLRVGATYVNQHLFDVRNPTNNLRGDVHASEPIPALLAVRISDDSPQDGRGGPVVYGVELIVNGERGRTPAPDVVRQDARNTFTTVGTTSRTAGEFLPSAYYDASVARSTGPYRGLEIPLYADYLYRRDHAADPEDPSVAGNTDRERLLEAVGWEDAGAVLAASGTEYLVYYFDLQDEPYVRSLEVEATVGNDYRIDVAAIHVVSPVSRTYDRIFSAPYFHTVRRAPGNVQDLSNVRRVRFDVGAETGQSVAGADVALDLPGFRLRAEVARSATQRRYPDGIPGSTTALADGAPALREWSGARHGTSDRAWYVQIQRETSSYGLGAEWFATGDDFNRPLRLRPGDVALGSGISNRVSFLSFLEDNDDGDSIPETVVLEERSVPDVSVFPGWDADNDGIPDINRNANHVPDYLEPFLMYDVEPEEYEYGLDFNNNDMVDRLEDDRKDELPYDRDLRGWHAYGRWQLVDGLDATAGWVEARAVAAGARNDQRYVRLRYAWQRPRLGRLVVEHETKRVWDSVPDDVFRWSAGSTATGATTRQTIPLAGRFLYQPEFVVDPLDYRNSVVHRFHLDGRLEWLEDWRLRSRLKLERNAQRRLVSRTGIEQSADRIGRLAWMSKVDYTLRWRELRVVPAVKGLWLKRTRHQARLTLAHTRTVIPLVTASYEFSPATVLKAGVQGLPGWWYRSTDLADPRNSFREQTAIALLSNAAPYSGYRVTVNLGATHTRRRFVDPFRALENFDTTTIFLRVYLGNESSTLY